MTSHTNTTLPILTGSESQRSSVLNTLAYFDIFNYPLKKEEILQYSEIYLNKKDLEEVISSMLAEKLIYCHYDLYMLQNNPLLSHRRLQGNARAEFLLPKAIKIARFLQRFPFVEGVGISGSLSKNFAEQKADFDFFIITTANRLWLARTFMHIFKKFTFLAGKQHQFCMNYYVDQDALLITNQNIFTAIELKTLLPVSGTRAFETLFETNTWSDHYLPQCDFRPIPTTVKSKGAFKRFLEWSFDNSFGEKLDNLFWKLTSKRWKRKQEDGARNEKGQTMGLITGKHFARSNPGAFQEKVLNLYKKKISGFTA